MNDTGTHSGSAELGETSVRAALIMLAMLLVLSIAVRLPFYFRDVINWDESTFILQGQSLLDGHLPYTAAWEIKPPLADVFFAAAIALFGKSVIGIRFAGTLCICLTAWFVFLMGRQMGGRLAGICAAVLYVLYASLFPAGQATMTEIVAAVPMVAALWLAGRHVPNYRHLFWCGVLMATAYMVRMGLAYVAVGVGSLLLSLHLPRTSWRTAAWVFLTRGVAYSAGNLLVILLTLLPYLLTQQAGLWWRAVVLAPLSYAGSQMTMWQAAQRHFQNLVDTIVTSHHGLALLSVLVWVGALLTMMAILRRWKVTTAFQRQTVLVVGVALVGCVYSLVSGGAAFSNDLHQLLPLVTILTGVSHAVWMRRTSRAAQVAIFCVVLAAVVPSVGSEYFLVAQRVAAGKPWVHGTASEIASLVQRRNTPDKSMYLMTHHLAYWLSSEQPISKITHPSNIGRSYLIEFALGEGVTPEAELARILSCEPAFIVTAKDIVYLKKHDQAKTLLQRSLTTDYDEIAQFDRVQVYQRRTTIADRDKRSISASGTY